MTLWDLMTWAAIAVLALSALVISITLLRNLPGPSPGRGATRDADEK